MSDTPTPEAAPVVETFSPNFSATYPDDLLSLLKVVAIHLPPTPGQELTLRYGNFPGESVPEGVPPVTIKAVLALGFGEVMMSSMHVTLPTATVVEMKTTEEKLNQRLKGMLLQSMVEMFLSQTVKMAYDTIHTKKKKVPSLTLKLNGGKGPLPMMSATDPNVTVLI